MSAIELLPADPFAPALALRAPTLLAEFNRAGVLAAADVHVAQRLGRLAGVEDEPVLLAAALAVRAPRTGHVFVDLASAGTDLGAGMAVAATDGEDRPEAVLGWPEPAGWVSAVAGCGALVASGEGGGEGGGEGAGERGEARPLRLVGTRLYLDRYWREERALAAVLLELSGGGIRPTRIDRLADGIARLFPDPEDQLQRIAAACAVLRGVSVVAGGPGTGKTTTVARVAALLAEQVEPGETMPLVALCAPTGKAAARLEEAVREESERMAISPETRSALLELRASTIHRLLGWRPGSRGRFRHDAANRLPHDVVVVDETSMVGLSLMVRLLEAVRSDARVVLIGDPDQLTAIEAGAVLRDIVGPAVLGPRMSGGARALLSRITGGEVPQAPAGMGQEAPATPFADGVVVLERGHRFGAQIGALAGAIRRGDSDGAIAAIAAAGDSIDWLRPDGPAGEALTPLPDELLSRLREAVTRAGAGVVAAARAGDGLAALRELAGFRLLCAHRHGPFGVSRWSLEVERWLLESIEGFDPGEAQYPGRPLLITENDYELGLYNGDVGVIVQTEPGRLAAVFERDGEAAELAPSRLDSAQTLHAMTIHKSQGSQFETAAVVMPEPESRILTRELLYTAVTRARRRLILVGSEASLRSAVERPVARATGLQQRLWRA